MNKQINKNTSPPKKKGNCLEANILKCHLYLRIYKYIKIKDKKKKNYCNTRTRITKSILAGWSSKNIGSVKSVF